MSASKVNPTHDNLDTVNIDLLGEEPGYIRLHNRGCGHTYNVSRKDIGLTNWFICSRHKVHNHGKVIIPRRPDSLDRAYEASNHHD